MLVEVLAGGGDRNRTDE